MSTINLPALQQLTKTLEVARAHQATTRQLVAALDLVTLGTSVQMVLEVNTHDRPGCTVETIRFGAALTSAFGYSTSPPVAVAGNKRLLEAARQHARDLLLACDGKVEGVEFQIRQLARGAQPRSEA